MRRPSGSLDELQPFCKEKNVRICIENLFEAPREMQLEQFDKLFERYPADIMGYEFNTGHANLVGGTILYRSWQLGMPTVCIPFI